MDKIVMDKNVCDNTLVFGSCHARSCIEVPSLTAGRAKWKAFYDKFPWLKGQPFYLRRSCFWDGKDRNLKAIKGYECLYFISNLSRVKRITPRGKFKERLLYKRQNDAGLLVRITL